MFSLNSHNQGKVVNHNQDKNNLSQGNVLRLLPHRLRLELVWLHQRDLRGGLVVYRLLDRTVK
jgi:hypothetical protein